MPPRYAYWTILIDDQPTAFRAGSQDDLMPTFKRLKLKHASAKMMWWQNGKLWDSRLDAQEAMHMRGQKGRESDFRQRNMLSERRPTHRVGQSESKGGDFRQRQQQRQQGKLEWKPKGELTARPRPEWRPKTAGTPSRPHALRPSSPHALRPSSPPREKREGGLDWKPKGATTAAPKRKWIPKEEFKKSQGIEARRDKNWRPGGEHKDPRQKYKDAKKAKWTRFKQTVRKNWQTKQGRKKKGGA